MLRSLFLTLAIGQVHGLVAPAAVDSAPNEATALFVKDGSNGTLKPYDAFDYPNWAPEASLYGELPMVEKHTVVDGKQLVYQDFNISALSADQFREHFMGQPKFYDSDGKFVPSAEEVKAYQASLVAREDDPEAVIAVPEHLTKRAWPDVCFYSAKWRCSSTCTDLISRGVRQSVNNDVYGYYHYVSDSQCGTGAITKTVSVTHTSGVTIGGTGQIPGWGKGWTKLASTFFNTFGFSVGRTPDSVTTGISYSGNCGPFNVCFLWERPHFRVDKGVIVTQHIDVNSKRACTNPTVTPYEAHIMHTQADPAGAASHGLCYSMARHGCGGRVAASNQMIRCPGNF
ncbi:hypothetical protein EsH8_X_000343 [Colletotrichum jinshuiense]